MIRNKEENKDYVSVGTRQFDGFKGRWAYTFPFIPAESYKFAVTDVGNSEEKVYAVYPRTAKLSDFISGD